MTVSMTLSIRDFVILAGSALALIALLLMGVPQFLLGLGGLLLLGAIFVHPQQPTEVADSKNNEAP